MLVTACASQPKGPQQAQFDSYWRCAYAAAIAHAADTRIATTEVALRAQAHCYGAYLRYQSAQERYTKSVVSPGDYDMATTLADAQAAQRKQDVTNRLIQYVDQARQ